MSNRDALNTLSAGRDRLPLIIIIGAYVVLALIYVWATPPLEASDELWHIGMIQHIVETGQLPVQVAGVDTIYEQEGSQPPLYYLLAAALAQPFDRSDFDTLRQPNPHVIAGVPGNVGNKNLVLHDSPPVQGAALAAYAVRLFSIGLGCVTVAAVYGAAQALVGAHGRAPLHKSISILATGLTAFNPMFVFISASVNNDNLVTTLNSLIIWQMLVMIRGPHPLPLSLRERGAETGGFIFRRSLLIAVLMALAALSKLSGLVLVPVVALAALWLAYRSRDWRGLVTLGALMLAAWLVIAGWWYLRNVQLYGELFGTGTMALVAGARATPFTLPTLLDEFQGFRFGYWGVFGAFNIMTFRPFYDVMDALTVMALAGLAVYLWHTRRDRDRLVMLLLLGVIVVIGAAAVINWTAQTYASQGRLLFPYMAAISPLLAVGLAEIMKRTRYIVSLPVVVIVLFALFALVVPFASIAPQYAAPAPLTRLPDDARPVYARFGGVELIGYDTPDSRYAPGDSVPVTLYWRVVEPSERDLSLWLHAVLLEGTVIGKVDSYPGGGRLRTTASAWQPGAIYADTYAIPLTPSPPASLPQGEGGKTVQSDWEMTASKLRIQVGWWDYPTETYIEPAREDGSPLDVVMLDAGGFADGRTVAIPDDAVRRDAAFGGKIRLLGYRLQGDILGLYWESIALSAEDFTVFAQVLDGQNEVVGQGDVPPDLPTRFWRPGERYVTQHRLVYPEPLTPGDYRLVIGWYNPVDNTRLDSDMPDDVLLLEVIIVQ